MRILVTGATSGLGRNAIDFLQHKNIALRATGRNLAEGEKLQSCGIDFVAADLAKLDEATAKALFDDIDIVWHCAALSSPWGQYDDFYAANVTATENIILYATKFGIKQMVHISTPSIYFDYTPHFNVTESFQAKQFVNHYASTKMLAEQKVQSAAIAHPDTHFIMLRPRAIFGEHDRVLLPRLMALLKQHRGNLILPRKGNAILDMTYSQNVIYAMWLATQLSDDKKRAFSGRAYNISNQEPRQLKWVLTQLLDIELGHSCTIKSLPYPLLAGIAKIAEIFGTWRHKEPSITLYGIGALNYDMTLSNEAAQRDLGYFPQFDMTDAISRTANWFKANGNNHNI